jgi:hypothetical protein
MMQQAAVINSSRNMHTTLHNNKARIHCTPPLVVTSAPAVTPPQMLLRMCADPYASQARHEHVTLRNVVGCRCCSNSAARATRGHAGVTCVPRKQCLLRRLYDSTAVATACSCHAMTSSATLPATTAAVCSPSSAQTAVQAAEPACTSQSVAEHLLSLHSPAVLALFAGPCVLHTHLSLLCCVVLQLQRVYSDMHFISMPEYCRQQ